MYTLYRLLTHESTREVMIAQDRAIVYIMDLMNDKNRAIRTTCLR